MHPEKCATIFFEMHQFAVILIIPGNSLFLWKGGLWRCAGGNGGIVEEIEALTARNGLPK